MKIAFPVEIVPDDNGTSLVTCPLLPEVTTFTEDGSDWQENARDAIEEALASRMARWANIPLPAADAGALTVRPCLQTEMKLVLFWACKQAGTSRADLVRALGWHREQVDRLFRLDHASRIDQIEAAMKAVGRTISIDVMAAA